jgi:hypothetical protein
MATLSFTNNSYLNREARKINLEVPDDMNIFEFKIMCARLAAAMGYTDTSIKRAFVTLEYESESDKEFRKFLQTITEFTGSLEHY